MNAGFTPILLSAGMMSVAAIYAVTVDRFRNRRASTMALAGGVMPWVVIASLLGWLPAQYVLWPFALYGGLLLFAQSLLGYWLGPRFPNWEKASYAMLVGVLGGLGVFSSFYYLSATLG
ncbi:MAG: hypothetical protein ABIS50_18180 [Luteolibacter sp.]|uniref:hypothetical protein n=1 Tax=Luteolibacter sp. TaxID=1962973 RepID=UPI003263C036